MTVMTNCGRCHQVFCRRPIIVHSSHLNAKSRDTVVIVKKSIYSRCVLEFPKGKQDFASRESAQALITSRLKLLKVGCAD